MKGVAMTGKGNYSVRWRSLVVLGVSMWLLGAGAPLSAAEVIVTKGPGDCSADNSFQLSPPTPPVGGVVDVTIVVTNTDSQEAIPNPGTPIPQQYSKVSFWPSCNGAPPCTPDNPLKATFIPGSESTTCAPGSMTASALTFMGVAGAQIDFDFVPDMVLAPPLPMSCTISFKLQTDPMLMDMAGISFQSRSSGTCDPGTGVQPVGSVDTGTITVTAVPTLGSAALAALAMILAFGGWHTLRRRTL